MWGLAPRKDGEWVLWDDVKNLLHPEKDLLHPEQDNPSHIGLLLGTVHDLSGITCSSCYGKMEVISSIDSASFNSFLDLKTTLRCGTCGFTTTLNFKSKEETVEETVDDTPVCNCEEKAGIPTAHTTPEESMKIHFGSALYWICPAHGYKKR